MLKECLGSLSKLDYPNYEIIVVDAGSTDGSAVMAKRFFPKVVLIEKGRIGIGEAINVGIKRAKGEVIIFDFNTDEIASVDWLRRLVDALKSSWDIGIVGGTRMVYGSDGIIDDAGAKIHFLGHQSKTGHGRKFADYQKHLREVDYLGCIAVKREVIDKVGLLDEAYFIYGEDADFCIRTRKKGYKIVQVPQAITYHKVSATIGSVSPRQIYFLRRAQIRLALKLFPLPKMIITLIWAGFLISTDAMMLFPLFRKLVSYTPYSHLTRIKTLYHVKASLNAFLWNIKNMPSTMSARSNIL